MYTRKSLENLDFGPYEVNILDHNLQLDDGTKLSVRFWIPGSEVKKAFDEGELTRYCEASDINEASEEKSFPSVMEYIPYCKSSWTRERDHLRHPWLASHGFVILRPDMRGSGDSQGLYFDEYLEQEQLDACEIIAWIAKQSWSNGNVGMFGKSWGGFNGLQVAFHKPQALKAVISLYSTDDRFNDDVHWKGGALIASQMLSWSSVMLAWNAR